MARIRTVKPDFFRHELLQDLEKQYPGCYVMLVYIGIWSLCDKEGRFEWKPRTMKLDILPFLDFDMEQTLLLLERFSLIAQYEHDGKLYGLVKTFKEHQRINGKEAQEPAKYPVPIEFNKLSQGSTGEAPGKQSRSQEGKGREREMEREMEGEMEGEGNGTYVASAPCASRGSDECDFDKFWAAYPKKVGRGAAQKAWDKRKPKADIDRVLAALAWQVESAQWQRDNGQYIPNPATYINQSRELDEPPAVSDTSLTENGRKAAAVLRNWVAKKQAEVSNAAE